jgi:hypothetical protein
MKKKLDDLGLPALLDAYMQESKEFSTALNNGASWENLQERRIHMRLINILINRKYDEKYGQQRRRNKPPHGD